jgi:hypothetical protein
MAAQPAPVLAGGLSLARARNLVDWGIGWAALLHPWPGPMPSVSAAGGEEMEARRQFRRDETASGNPAKRMAGQMKGGFNCFLRLRFWEPAARLGKLSQ